MTVTVRKPSKDPGALARLQKQNLAASGVCKDKQPRPIPVGPLAKALVAARRPARLLVMPAYIISELVVRDADAFQAYRTRAAESIAAHGGRYLVRGGRSELLEGDGPPPTFVVVEFPDLQQARVWYRSAEYARALERRDQALSRRLSLVEGVARQE